MKKLLKSLAIVLFISSLFYSCGSLTEGLDEISKPSEIVLTESGDTESGGTVKPGEEPE